MRGLQLISAFVVIGLIVAGCEKKDEMKAAAEDATQKASDAAGDAADKAKEMGTAAGEKAKEVGSAVADEATKMIDQVKTYINEKRYNDAESLIAKLDGMRAQLPEKIQKMIDDCKTMLEKAKASMK